MFTVTWISRNNELTALMAAGIPKLRIMAPVLLAAASVSFFAAGFRESVIPRFRHKIAREASDLDGDRANQLRPRYDHLTNILLGGNKTVRSDKKIMKPVFTLPRELNQYGRQLIAAQAVYLEETPKHPAGYLMRKVSSPEGICKAPSLCVDESPVIVTPTDANWLKEDQVFVVSQVDYEMLEGGDAWREYSSTAELIRGLANSSADFGGGRPCRRPFADCTALSRFHFAAAGIAAGAQPRSKCLCLHRTLHSGQRRIHVGGFDLPVAGGRQLDQPAAGRLGAAFDLRSHRSALSDPLRE